MWVNIVVAALTLCFAGVFLWGFIRLYFAEREAHLKRVITQMEEGDENGK